MVLHLSDSRPSCCEIQDFPPPSSNNNQDKMGYISMKKHQHPRIEDSGGDDDNTDLARKKKAKMSNSETEATFSSSDHSCFAALVTAWNLQEDALYLPKDFRSSNGLKRRCRKIVLTDGRERSWGLDMRFNKSSDTFYITRGWRNFCEENGKKAGSFLMFKLMENEETPLLSFCPAESRGEKVSRKESLNVEPSSGKQISKEERKKNHLRCRDISSPIQKRFVILTLTYDSLKRGTKWEANLRRETTGSMNLGKGWKKFAKANNFKIGESFTLESIWNEKTPMLSLLHTDPSSDGRQQGEYCSEASEEECFSSEPNSGDMTRKAKNSIEVRSSREVLGNKCLPDRRGSLSPIGNRFVTLTLTHDSLKRGRLNIPLPFMRKNGLDKPGMITLLDKDGAKWEANLRRETTGSMNLGKGWKDFAKANNFKTGESFTLESFWENGTPMLSLFSIESTSNRRQQVKCLEDSKKESFSTEPSSGNKTKVAKNKKEEGRDSSSVIQNRFVTLTLTPEDVRDCKLIIPSQFLKANGMDKLGKITLLGKEGTKCSAYLLSRDGFVALGIDWNGFCEANGVKTGESFTLECLHEQDTTPVLKFCSISGD